MTIQEVTSSIEELIFSENTSDCLVACEILKGLDFPCMVKVNLIQPIVSSFKTLIEGCLKVGALDRADNLIEKGQALNETIIFLIKEDS